MDTASLPTLRGLDNVWTAEILGLEGFFWLWGGWTSGGWTEGGETDKEAATGREKRNLD